MAAYGALGLGPVPQLLFTTFSSSLGVTHILLPYMNWGPGDAHLIVPP